MADAPGDDDRPIRVAIADDSVLLRDGLERLLTEYGCVGPARTWCIQD